MAAAELVEYVAKSLVDDPDAVKVEVVRDEGGTVIELHVAEEDMGKGIGRNGSEHQECRQVRAEERVRFLHGVPLSQARACERRSHSSRPMRPRRASPNGTSERSSTRPPKYRASGSRTTSRGSPTAIR